jgi:hypothetical protein
MPPLTLSPQKEVVKPKEVPETLQLRPVRDAVFEYAVQLNDPRAVLQRTSRISEGIDTRFKREADRV